MTVAEIVDHYNKDGWFYATTVFTDNKPRVFKIYEIANGFFYIRVKNRCKTYAILIMNKPSWQPATPEQIKNF